MAKYRIPVEHLPPPAKATGDHVFRFRIVSEDRNRLSQYSTLYVTQSLGQIWPEQTGVEYSASSNVVTIYWNTPSLYNIGASAVGASVIHNHESEWKQHPIDIFVKWDGGVYEYFGRTNDNEMSIIKQSGATTLQVLGQIANHPPSECLMFKIFETEIISL